MASRVQFTFTFINAQPGARVRFSSPVWSSATAAQPEGLYLTLSGNTVSAWSDAQYLVATTNDGQGNEISATATVASPTVSDDDGVGGGSGTYVQAVMLPSASGGDDTAAIQAVLTAGAGKVVKGIPGQSYSINAPLVIASNTYLDMTGCTVTLAAASNCNLLRNTAVGTTKATASDGAMTSGSSTLTSAVSPVAIGDTVIVAGAAAGAGNLTGIVSGVSPITLIDHSGNALLAGATVSGATVTVKARDSNITVDGGTWDRVANVGTTVNMHILRFWHIDGISVRNVRFASTQGKFALNFADAKSFAAERLTFATKSDGVHVTGPASNGTIRSLYGTTGDDFVALTARDWTGYDAVMGDIVGLEIADLHPNGSLLAGLKVIGGTGTKIRRVAVRGMYGTVGQAPVRVIDDTTGPTDIDIDIEGIWTVQGTGYSQVELGISAGRRIRIADQHYESAEAQSAISCYTNGATFSLSRLTVENLHVDSTGAAFAINHQYGSIGTLTVDGLYYPACSAAQVIRLGGVSVGDCVVRNAVVTWSVGCFLVGMQNACTAHRVVFSSCKATSTFGGGSGALIATGTGVTFVQVSDCETVALSRVALLQAACEIHLTDSVLGVSGTGQIVNITSASGTHRLLSSGNSNAAGRTSVARSSSQTVSVNGTDLPTDAAILTPLTGDVILNSNASTLYGGANALITYDGTRWRGLVGFLKKYLVTLVAGTATTADTNITATSEIRLTTLASGGTVGHPYVSARTAATSFAITSTSGTDTSTILAEVVAYA